MNFSRFEQLLRALGNKRRLQILAILKARKGMTVGKLAKAIHLSIKSTSHHLVLLSALNIVQRRKRGKYVSYRLSLHQEPPVKGILKLL